jgi:hypothetical protein
MTAERDARNGAPYHRRHSGARLQGASPESIFPDCGYGFRARRFAPPGMTARYGAADDPDVIGMNPN